MINIKLVIIVAVLFLSNSLSAFSDELGKKLATQGNTKGVTACISCHGINGEGMAQAGFPRLSNLDPRYLQKQLQDFKNGTRKNPIMEPIAKALTNKESIAVSNYLVKLKPVASNTRITDTQLLTQGRQLATIGNWGNNIPACFACHGRSGYGVNEHFPALAGQHASYISQQIQAWKSGLRKNDPNDLMKVIAQRLSNTEIKAISTYLASLSANKK